MTVMIIKGTPQRDSAYIESDPHGGVPQLLRANNNQLK
jgi:hypothetical protein